MKLTTLLFTKKEAIRQKAAQLGFENVRIYKMPDTENFLHLLVSVNRQMINSSANNDELLRAVLMNDLGCMIVVTVESKLNEFFRTAVIENAIPLDATDNDFKQLFHVHNLNEVTFDRFDKEEIKNQRILKRLLPLANKIMEKTSYSIFFAQPSSTPAPISAGEQTLLLTVEDKCRKHLNKLSLQDREECIKRLAKSLGLEMKR